MTEKKYTRVRAKALKIGVSEEQALEIVLPFVNVTAYTLSITSTAEMPDPSSFVAAVRTAKTKLAILIANAIGEPVNPDHLCHINVGVIAIGGYFKISVLDVDHKALINKGYSITLECVTGLPLVEKFRQTNTRKGGSKAINAMINAFNKMGL